VGVVDEKFLEKIFVQNGMCRIKRKILPNKELRGRNFQIFVTYRKYFLPGTSGSRL
jgi:hypothetical protein